MGTLDFEIKSKQKAPNSSLLNMIEYIGGNIDYIYVTYAQWFYQDNDGKRRGTVETPYGLVTKAKYSSVLNYPIFKFTKLREEIIMVYMTTFRPSSDGKPVKPGKLAVAVNERSFWKRFSVFTKSRPSSPIDINEGFTALDILDIATDTYYRDSEIDRIELNIMPLEAQVMSFEKTEDMNGNVTTSELEDSGAVNKAICRINNIEHYNKRMFLEMFKIFDNAGGFKGSVLGDGKVCLMKLGDYKDSSSPAYYNPNDPDYAVYNMVYS